MKLSQLTSDFEVLKISGDFNTDITGISYDSRLVKPGDLFVTWRGVRSDGAAYVEEALKRGAVALCLEGEGPSVKNVPCLFVRDGRSALADLASVFYGFPTKNLSVIGITGTNGKTTVSFLIESILQASGYRPGLLGTIHYKMANRLIPAERTTPESVELQKYFREMLDAGCRSVVMEVSSHALHQGRVRGIDFCGAVFTNLSQDHLDYHKDLENYFLAKSILFEGLTSDKFAVINSDDPYGQRLLKMIRARKVSYGFTKDSSVKGVEKPLIRISRHEMDTRRSLCEIVFPDGHIELQVHLIGRFNLYNILAAFATGWALGIDPLKMKEALESFDGVSGRVEFVPITAPFQVVVDYAHTEDALEKVLSALKPLVKGRLITVFGCGGDRDRTKRPKMGMMSAKFSDWVIITSDNPRSEDPAVIADQIEEGIKLTQTSFTKILDRKAAIEFALSQAKADDLILIAGKGHEKFQEIGSVRIPFDDVNMVKELAKNIFSKVST